MTIAGTAIVIPGADGKLKFSTTTGAGSAVYVFHILRVAAGL
jgi:hypothetical protein